MKYWITALALFAVSSPSLAGAPGSWQIEPPGEGSGETYIYSTSNGGFLTGPKDSGIWLVYGGNQAPNADGSCSFESCSLNVIIGGKNGYEQRYVNFNFSDGSSVKVDNIDIGSGTLISDFARVNWPEMRKITDGLKKSAWVDVSYPGGASHRFALKGSSAALIKGAAIATSNF